MEEIKGTAGETATQVEKTASLTTVIQLVATLLYSIGESFKKVGGNFVSKDEIRKFVKTLYTLSSVGPYDSIMIVNGTVFPLATFMVDSRFAKAFVMPRAVTMPGVSPFRKDVSVHFRDMNIMTPAEMIEFQHKYFQMFKLQPQLISVEEAIKPIFLGEIVDVSNGSKCHVEDLASIKSVPIELAITDELYAETYFNYNIEEVIRMVVVNYYSGLK